MCSHTVWESWRMSELRLEESSSTSLIRVSSVRLRLACAAQCMTRATSSTASVSCRHTGQVQHLIALKCVCLETVHRAGHGAILHNSTHTHTRTRTRTRTQTRTHSHMQTHSGTHTHTHSHTHRPSYTHKHSYTYALTQTRTHTHTHTHILNRPT